jgi:hypothetical protein
MFHPLPWKRFWVHSKLLGKLITFLCISFGGVFTLLFEKFHGSCWCFNLKGTITTRNIFEKKDSITGDKYYFYAINLTLWLR